MVVLFFADTHGNLNTKGLLQYLSENSCKIDAVISCGDVYDSDFQTIKALSLDCPIYGILGNHDYWEALKRNEITDLHEKVIQIKDFAFAGMYGSIRYKSADTPMLSHDESIQIAENIPECDIFITHDKAGNSLSGNAHGGLAGITKYLNNHKPGLHIHGHLHEFSKRTVAGHPSVGIYQFCLMKIEKDSTGSISCIPLYSYMDYWNSINKDCPIKWNTEKGTCGNPQYNYEDEVSFFIKPYKAKEEILCKGKVYIVDAYGTFEQKEEPSYDILVENYNNSGQPCLVKHIRESEIIPL